MKTMETIQNGITKEAAYLQHIYSDDCILEYYDF